MTYNYTRKGIEYTLPFDPTQAGYSYIVCECPAIKFDKHGEGFKKKLLLYPAKNHITSQHYNTTLKGEYLYNGEMSREIHEYPKTHEEFLNLVAKYGL